MGLRNGFAALMVAAVALAACGGGEPAQRKAFIEFLQTRINAKPGIHVPHLTAEEASAFGDYARQYAIIGDFNAALDHRITDPLQRAIASGVPRSLAEVVSRRNDIAAVRDGLGKIRAALAEQLAIADAAHAALKQPDDLKPVFDVAYARDVTQPAQAFAAIFPDLDSGLAAMVGLADFIDLHHDAVTVNGPLIETSDASLRPPLQQLLDTLRSKSEAADNARRRLATLAGG